MPSSLLSRSQNICMHCSQKNSSFFIRDNRLKKGGGDQVGKEGRRNSLCAKKPLIIMMMIMKMKIKMMVIMTMIMMMLLLIMMMVMMMLMIIALLIE